MCSDLACYFTTLANLGNPLFTTNLSGCTYTAKTLKVIPLFGLRHRYRRFVGPHHDFIFGYDAVS